MVYTPSAPTLRRLWTNSKRRRWSTTRPRNRYIFYFVLLSHAEGLGCKPLAEGTKSSVCSGTASAIAQRLTQLGWKESGYCPCGWYEPFESSFRIFIAQLCGIIVNGLVLSSFLVERDSQSSSVLFTERSWVLCSRIHRVMKHGGHQNLFLLSYFHPPTQQNNNGGKCPH